MNLDRLIYIFETKVSDTLQTDHSPTETLVSPGSRVHDRRLAVSTRSWIVWSTSSKQGSAIHYRRTTRLQKLETFQEVLYIGAQWFERGVGSLHPHGRLFADKEAASEGLQLRGHHHQPFDGFLDVLQRRSDDAQQPAEHKHQ